MAKKKKSSQSKPVVKKTIESKESIKASPVSSPRTTNTKLYTGLAIAVVLALVIFLNANTTQQDVQITDDSIVMYYFHLSTCPHCIEQNKFNDYLEAKYPNLVIIEYEMTRQDSKQTYFQMASQIKGLDENNIATPTTIIGDQFNVGFGSAETTGVKIEQMIQDEIKNIAAKKAQAQQ